MAVDMSTEAAVRALITRYEHAFRYGDAASFEEVLDQHGAYVAISGETSAVRTFVLAEVASVWLSAVHPEVAVSDVRVHVHDSHEASVDLRFDHPEQSFHDHLVLAKRPSGEWRIVAKISTSL